MTNLLIFDQSTALSLYQSGEQFPIDLDIAWQWLGYTKKQAAMDTLKRNFSEGVDFLPISRKAVTGGRPAYCTNMTIDCFKCLGMMAGTEQGKAIRKYFLECEHIAKLSCTTKATKGESLQFSVKVSELDGRRRELKRKIDVALSHLKQLEGEYIGLDVEMSKLYVLNNHEIGEEYIKHKKKIDDARASVYLPKVR